MYVQYETQQVHTLINYRRWNELVRRDSMRLNRCMCEDQVRTRSYQCYTNRSNQPLVITTPNASPVLLLRQRQNPNLNQ
jgi:hypothetical protein